MLIGVPTEIKAQEFRVGMTPAGVRELKTAGHQILVQSGAGAQIGLTDELYRAAGAVVVDTAEQVFNDADMIIKVKEPQPQECRLLKTAADPVHLPSPGRRPRSGSVIAEFGRNVHCLRDSHVSKRWLTVAGPHESCGGRLSVQAGAHHMEIHQGGGGALLGGVPGVAPAKVLVLGGGVVGSSAIRVALGMGADVTVVDRSVERLGELDEQYRGQLRTVYSTAEAIERHANDADLIIGAVLIPGASAPKLISRDMLGQLKQGAVMVDVAIDQGGCFETSRPTTHAEPTYLVDGVLHYCVANMPGAVARTSTMALTNATLPYIQQLASGNYRKLLSSDPHFAAGLNVFDGRLTHPAVAEALDAPWTTPDAALSQPLHLKSA
ncbi:MAG: alanine dehydrogenase [Halieaceae bacterium]|nr:MAG: alanine dehydrogenase [Halieaceae bacterium]